MTEVLEKYKEAIASGALLAAALIVEHSLSFDGQPYVYLVLYGLSYLIVGGPIWLKAFKSIKSGTIFGEFLLMGIATIGAFVLGKYAEGVAVMLFYTVGENLQHEAVYKARHSIRQLIDQQPDVATVERGDNTEQVPPSDVNIDEIIQVKPGEKIPLDGVLLCSEASFNTAALTGESKPMRREAGDKVWAGSINQDAPVRIKVTSGYQDTKLSRILSMVQEASKRKAPTQRFITRFAKIYTPVVVWLAVALTILPYLFVENYVFRDWLYRALIFLVVSCPCGLVISIPLSYFGGIGAASRNGILLKGSDFLDRLRNLDVLFMDKTGTLTEGSFEVQQIYSSDGYDRDELLRIAASLEQQSTHPIAKAILKQVNGQTLHSVENQEEVSGKGLKGEIDKQPVLVGSRSFLEQEGVSPNETNIEGAYTSVHIALGGKHIGTIAIADQIKDDSKTAIQELRDRGIKELVMLSGDNRRVADYVAETLRLDKAHGGLLPEDKYRLVEASLGPSQTVGFMGDGVNDAPVITLADVGIAMGGIGSDATIETSDVVIQTDQPSKLVTAIDIGRFTHRIVWQNIGFALGIKILVMGMAALGIATMWEAIFADVGVALIAVGNAIRIQRKYSGN